MDKNRLFEIEAISIVLLIGVVAAMGSVLAHLLRQKQKLKSEADENQILVNILCHDLANPLMVLEFSALRLKSQLPPEHPEQKIHLKIKNSIDMLKETLGKVRKLQESRHGKQALLLEPLDPVQIVDELKLLFEDQLIEKNLELRIESFLSEQQLLLADRSLLKTEVLANLISNAIKFSPPNRHIDMYFLTEEDQIVIYLRDYGIGIPQEFIPRLFEVRSGAQRPGTLGEKGSGLGLSLAKTCVQMMDGSIEVESYQYLQGISGPGTMFTLRLKAASRPSSMET